MWPTFRRPWGWTVIEGLFTRRKREKERARACADAEDAVVVEPRDGGPDTPPMGPGEFLRRVLPAEGRFVSWRKADGQPEQKSYTSIDALRVAIEALQDVPDVYFCVAALDPTKKGRTAGEVIALRCLRADIDAGPEKYAKHGDKVYETQRSAIADVRRAVGEGLPAPTLAVNSGAGLHLYWILTADATPAQWKPVAEALKDRLAALKVRQDPGVTADVARVLRPVGSLHSNGNRVTVLSSAGPEYSLAELASMLGAAEPRGAESDPLGGPAPRGAGPDINADILTPPSGAHHSLAQIGQACAAVGAVRDRRGNVPEPHWRLMLGLASFCDIDGAPQAHDWSEGHPQYSREETDRKMAGWRGSGPPLCKTVAAEFAGCAQCEHFRKISTPLQLGVVCSAPAGAGVGVGVVVLPDRKRLAGGGVGAPLNTVTNVVAAAKGLGWSVRYNLMTRKTELSCPGLTVATDGAENTALALFGDGCVRLGLARDGLLGLVNAAAALAAYHPVLDWIEAGGAWDGTSRLRGFHETLTLRDPSQAALRDQLIDTWAIATIAGIVLPGGYAHQGMLVIVGPQGVGKTRWVNALLPVDGAVRTGLHLDPTDRDSVVRATSAAIVELGELDHTTRRSDVSALKAFITAPADILRTPYAPSESTYPRRTGFVGTVNGTGFLADDTGTRRFWALNVTHCRPPEADFMRLVWGEYLAKFRSGAPGYLDDATLRGLRESNAEHEVTDPLRERIQRAFDWGAAKAPDWPDSAVQWVTATEVCMRVGIQQPTKSDSTRAGGFVRELNGGHAHKGTAGARLLAVPGAAQRGCDGK